MTDPVPVNPAEPALDAIVFECPECGVELTRAEHSRCKGCPICNPVRAIYSGLTIADLKLIVTRKNEPRRQ